MIYKTKKIAILNGLRGIVKLPKEIEKTDYKEIKASYLKEKHEIKNK